MKSASYGRTASFFMLMLTYCFLRSLSIIEARDLTNEVIRRREIGFVISSTDSKPYEDVIHREEVGGMKLYPRAEINGRSIKEIAIGSSYPLAAVSSNPLGNSPGVGHDVPPAKNP